MLYGTISELCTESSCPVMSAGDKWQYLWCDGVKIKKPISVSAPAYVSDKLTQGNHNTHYTLAHTTVLLTCTGHHFQPLCLLPPEII